MQGQLARQPAAVAEFRRRGGIRDKDVALPQAHAPVLLGDPAMAFHLEQDKQMLARILPDHACIPDDAQRIQRNQDGIELRHPALMDRTPHRTGPRRGIDAKGASCLVKTVVIAFDRVFPVGNHRQRKGGQKRKGMPHWPYPGSEGDRTADVMADRSVEHSHRNPWRQSRFPHDPKKRKGRPKAPGPGR